MYYFVHSIRSDWNNGNAHFQRGLVRALGKMGHKITCLEAESNWSFDNLQCEHQASQALEQYQKTYPDIEIQFYLPNQQDLRKLLADADIVIVHEWTESNVVNEILALQNKFGFRTLFHDTHHRASSNPGQIAEMQVVKFDGVLAFGEALRQIYLNKFGIDCVWTLHEAADTTVFYPEDKGKITDLVWIGNWGDGERSEELHKFLIYPVMQIPDIQAMVYGVRYPQEGLASLDKAGIEFKGYLPNLASPNVYHQARMTIHIPRKQYSRAMNGIPTIRVFEALASGIPLISAPWHDTEKLFCPGDFIYVNNEKEMALAIEYLLKHPKAAQEMAQRGLSTVLERHTCMHRAEQLTEICEEVLAA
jgi:spore maturation protein CgeB